MAELKELLTVEELPILGRVLKDVKLPSGLYVSLRETNAEDDGVISNYSKLGDGSAIDEYISGVTVKGEKSNRLTIEEVRELKVRDRYYILLLVRVLSLGNTLKFIHVCTSEKCQKLKLDNKYTGTEWEEDISVFITNLDNIPPNQEGTSSLLITPYSNGNNKLIEFTLDNAEGTRLRYKALTGRLENELAARGTKDFNQNSVIFARKLEVFIDNKWVEANSLKRFSSREAAMIRNHIRENDGEWQPLTNIVCPNCQTVSQTPIFGIKDFYFPEEI